MILSDLIKILEETGYPVAYDHFLKEAPPNVPYIAVTIPYSDNFFAENSTWKEYVIFNIELCTEKKDVAAEKKLTNILDENHIAWQKTSEDFIEDDGVFSIFYEFKEIYENGK